jgi:hypothetical protein
MLKQASRFMLGSTRWSTYVGEYVRSLISPTALRDCLNEYPEG